MCVRIRAGMSAPPGQVPSHRPHWTQVFSVICTFLSLRYRLSSGVYARSDATAHVVVHLLESRESGHGRGDEWMLQDPLQHRLVHDVPAVEFLLFLGKLAPVPVLRTLGFHGHEPDSLRPRRFSVSRAGPSRSKARN